MRVLSVAGVVAATAVGGFCACAGNAICRPVDTQAAMKTGHAVGV